MRSRNKSYALWSLVERGTTSTRRRCSSNCCKAKSKISALERRLRPDQVQMIAKRLGVTKKDRVDMNRRLGGDASLNARSATTASPARWNQDRLWTNTGPGDDADASEEFDNRRRRCPSAHVLNTGRKRRISEARRICEETDTLAEGEEFGLCRESVRKIEVRAFEKVRTRLKAPVAAMGPRRLAGAYFQPSPVVGKLRWA